MPKNDEFSGLFDMASKAQKKKKEEPQKMRELPPEFIQQDIEAAFERYKKMHDEIKNKIENAYEEAHVSPLKFKEYVSDPTHFSATDWPQIQKTRRELDEKLEEMLPQKSEAEEKTEGVPKEKRTKQGFVSKKRWLSMH